MQTTETQRARRKAREARSLAPRQNAAYVLTAIAFMVALPACAAEPLIIDDFEGGAGGWYEVDGNRATGGPEICKMTTAAGAKQGQAAARLQFAACPQSWAHMQMNIRTIEWSGADCDPGARCLFHRGERSLRGSHHQRGGVARDGASPGRQGSEAGR